MLPRFPVSRRMLNGISALLYVLYAIALLSLLDVLIADPAGRVVLMVAVAGVPVHFAYQLADARQRQAEVAAAAEQRTAEERERIRQTLDRAEARAVGETPGAAAGSDA